jgi:6-phosphogluconolactonase
MRNTIKIFINVDELSHFFAQEIATAIQQLPPGKFYSIALSGGSTPRKVFEHIALHYKHQVNWQKVQVFWSDERCVDPENEESNYRMAKESLLDKVPIPTENIFRIHGEADPLSEADRYSDIIRQHVLTQNNIPQFDLMMLGLGDDGHTASIFPDNLALFGSEKLIEVAENPYSKQKRITVTGKIINSARTVVFLATGDSKAEMVARIIERKKGWDKLPASMVNPGEGKLVWLLDEPAANKLDMAVNGNK